MEMKVLEVGRFSVYVYYEVGQPHHLPHCHVRWEGKDTVIALPSLKVLAGESLPKAGRQLLIANLEEIVEAWGELNEEN